MHTTDFTVQSATNKRFDTEGLALKYASTSSLARVADYQNATIYLDLSDNVGFSSYKVQSAHVALDAQAVIFIC